jgi:DNA-binding transcriptional regulator YiaG
VNCTGDCWFWKLAPCGDGYGVFRAGKLQIKAHRLAYLLWYGEVPAKMLAHSCDEKLCCNPDHLSPSTAKQNYREVLERGLDCVAKLNYEKVRELRRRSGESRASLAREYGVSPATVSSAISGRTWRHVS